MSVQRIFFQPDMFTLCFITVKIFQEKCTYSYIISRLKYNVYIIERLVSLYVLKRPNASIQKEK